MWVIERVRGRLLFTANLTPRKCLGFKTPSQAILKELGKDVQIRFA
jgi:IS30 family transposase